MNISLNLLSELIDLDGLSLDEISDMLTFAGIEVEGIEERGVSSDKVVVAQVVSAVQHPDAEKLKVTQVDTGDGTLHQIVCGAKNYKVGDKVPCALPGAVLPGNFQINVGKLRGVESCGMLCSATELGLPEKVDGLMILDPSLALGTPMRDLCASDALIEVEITPNRPDLLSHWGMAVELSAITGRSLKQDPAPALPSLAPAESHIRIESEKCPYYTATLIKGVTVKESPAWLQESLLAIGLRPINNAVDITNYVLHTLGHPLHVFDADKVNGGIVVRQAGEGEKLIALDGKEYTLNAEDLVISDEHRQGLAIAGVMGGESTSVTASTTNILLESALFNSSSVRRTSRKLALSSDSSYRFERGTTIYGTNRSCALALKLITELCEGTPEVTRYAGTKDQPVITVPFSMSALDQMTGSSIPHETATTILTALGITQAPESSSSTPTPEAQNTDASTELLVMPPWRLDLHRSADLCEEVVRVYGLDRIPSRMNAFFVEASPVDLAYDFQMTLRRRLAGAGFFEAHTIKLIADESPEATIAQMADTLALKPMLPGDTLRVALPLSEDHSILRPSLVPGLTAVAVRNVHQGADSLRFFEIGRTFRNAGGGKARDIETDVITLLMGGTLQQTSWSRPTKENIKAEDLLAVLQLLAPGKDIRLIPSKREGFAQSADIQINKKPVGCFARLSLSRCRTLDLPEAVFVAEIELKKLQEIATAPMQVRELPAFPDSSRDVALDVPRSLTNAQLEKALESVKQPLLVSAQCFDLFVDPSGEKLPLDRKSLAYSFTYRAPDRTLKSEEVDVAHKAVVDHLLASVKGIALRF